MRAVLSTTLALLASLSNAQFLISELSFGATGRLSPPESPGKIPGFSLSGSPSPEVLSNKLILTPISPGNARAAIWSDNLLLHDTFTLDVDFRANGPEPQRSAGGSFAIWLAFDGARRIATRDLYGAGSFEGLVLAVDSYRSSGGTLRAFLNDGSVEYASQSQVDHLAFGQCRFAYRNLGRPSQVKVRQTDSSFAVEIDGQTCFESNKVRIPTGYQIGLSASTPAVPDSFEVFKLVTMSDAPKVSLSANANANGEHKKPVMNTNQAESGSGSGSGSAAAPGDWENPADEDADVFQTSKAQFQDLHHRLQVTNHQLSALFRSVTSRSQMDEQRAADLKDMLTNIQAQTKQALDKLSGLGDLQGRMERLEGEVRGLRSDLVQRIADNERAVRGVLSGHHDSLSRRMEDSRPGHGKLIAVIIGSNVVIAVVYMVYKRRKSLPKKYL